MNQLAVINSSVPTEHEMVVFNTMAEQAVNSKMYRGIGDKSGVMMIMLAARELGLPPFQSLNGGLNIINGKVEISARMMSALIRKCGHKFSIQSSTDKECILVGTRGDTGETQSTSFSISEAQLAGLIKPGGGWSKWPKDMLFARALSRLARQLFSDVIGMGYVEGEIGGREVTPTRDEPEFLVVEELPEQFEPKHNLEEFTLLFPAEERDLAVEYVKVISLHFKWGMSETVEQLLKDTDKSIAKFKTWKSKQPKEKE